MTCAVLAVPDVSRVGGGAQAPRAAVPIPDTLTFLRVCLRSVLFSPGPGMAPPSGGMYYSSGSVEHPLQSRVLAWRPLRAPSACYSSGSVERPLQSRSQHGAPSRWAEWVTAAEVWSIPFSPGSPAWHPLRAACVTAGEVWSIPFSPGPGMAPPPGGMCYSRGSVERPLQSRSGMAPPPGTGTCYSRGSVALVCFVAGKCWLSSQLGPTSDSWALFPA